jgi:8-oxo-dGTP pyrophosphatase MutT (NUDIX family)
MAKEWEPPKGQMEWKEFAAEGFRKGQDIRDDQLIAAMRAGVLREVEEEAKIRPSHIRGLEVLPMSYSEDFKRAGPNSKFRYQFWRGTVSAADLRKAQDHLAEIVGSPEIQAALPADKKEKDAVAFWKPATNADWDKIRGHFSGTMTRMYYEYGVANSRK